MYQARITDQVSDVIEAVYDSAVAPGRSGVLLARMARLFDATFVDLYGRSHDRSRQRGVVHGLDAADYQELMLDSWAKRNVWSMQAPVTVAGEVKSTREMVSKAVLLRSEMYADFLGPRGLHEGMRMSIWSGAEGIEDVSMLRPWSAGEFGSDELSLARLLLPHLQRAALVRRRLQQADGAARAGLQALEALHHPVLLLDHGGVPIFLNAAAEALLRVEDGLMVRSGRLAASTHTLTTQLEVLLRRAAGGAQEPRAGTLRLARPSGAPALAMVAMPLLNDDDWAVGGRPAMMLCVGAPGDQRPGDRLHSAAPGGEAIGPFQRLFNLTAHEAALAADLLAGHDVGTIASRTGRSIATVRTHLSRLMAKTETTRQTDLVRLMTGFPRGPAA